MKMEERDMFLITHSIIAMSSVTFVLGLIYFYIFLQNHHRYMGFWGISWMLYSLSFVFDLLKFAGQDSYTFIIEKQTFYLLISILFLYGSYDFWDKAVPKFWLYFSAVCFLTIASATFLSSFFLPLMLHSSIFLCFISVWNGLMFLLYSWDSKISEKYLTGFIFIIWGIYKGYYPFIQPNFWLAPSSYLGGVILINILSILILLVHFKKNKNELMKREKRFRLLAENARDLIYLYSFKPSRKFDYVSPAVKQIMDLTPEELYNNPRIFFETVHPEDQSIIQETFNQPYMEPSDPILSRWIRKNGETVYGELHHTIIYDELGNVKALEGILRDVTDRKQVEKDLYRIQKSRQELITNISHELRTPITLIQGYIEAVLDGVIKKSNDIKKYLNLTHTKVVSLNRLINDLFQLTQLEAREIDFQLYEISINDLIREIYFKFEFDVENSGLNFELCLPNDDSHTHGKNSNLSKVSTDDDLIVTVDFDRIEQVFANLIFNAIKHTPYFGTISVGYTVTNNTIESTSYKNEDHLLTKGNNQIDSFTSPIPRNEIIISVKDDGSGINSEDLPFIFERFYRGNRTNISNVKGRGLGLSITKEIVEYHGGRIWAESKVGEGSVFYFTLPIY